uniref:Chromodomain Y like 2 n=1 Tax=Sus scrofa TaxID=9823 RepID=A0A8D0SWL2_PIG
MLSAWREMRRRLHRRPLEEGCPALEESLSRSQQSCMEKGSALTNGGLNLHSPVKRKLETEKDYVFDKRLRYSVRQNESNCRFRDIVVRKEEGFTHILLSSQTSDNNALTPEIMKEVRRALCNAATDDSKLLLLSAVGSVFCSGLDYSYLIGRLSSDRRKESTRIAEAIRDFVKAFIQFKKPIVVAINGPALGLGASILPLCDIVWASEKAWFQTPYATIRLTPAGCSSYTFPQILGVALANEMLFCGRKLTAQEACSRGLVSQVFWPTTFSQEVMLRVKEMASCSAVVSSRGFASGACGRGIVQTQRPRREGGAERPKVTQGVGAGPRETPGRPALKSRGRISGGKTPPIRSREKLTEETSTLGCKCGLKSKS